MATELKPCPFCGGPVRKKRLEHPGAPKVLLFMCYECGARVSFNVPTVDVPAQHGDDGPAFEAWNTRAAVTDEQFAYAVHDGRVWKAVAE